MILRITGTVDDRAGVEDPRPDDLSAFNAAPFRERDHCIRAGAEQVV